MKLAPKLIESFIAHPSPNCRAVLLFGPDSGLIRDRALRLRKYILKRDQDPFAAVELTEAQLLADPARLNDELAAISMLSPMRFITIRDATDKLSRIIESAADHLNQSTFLMITAGELSSRSTLRLWCEKQTNITSIACYHDEQRDIQIVIRKAFADAEIRIDPETELYLSQQLGNDRYVTYQELEKLITYAQSSRYLTLAQAQMLVDYNKETHFDNLIQSVADRDLPMLETTLALLLREHAQPVAYIRSLQRYFHRLYSIRAQMENGASAEHVVQSLRPPVFFKQIPSLTRHAHQWKRDQIVKALALFASAELACKVSDLPIFPASTRRIWQATQARH